MSDSLIRGSTDLHITTQGREESRLLGQKFAAKGCFWRVYTSTQARALETAHALATACPNVSFMRPSEELTSWPLGAFEGQPKDKVLPKIQELVEKRPWVVPEGMGPKSTKPGESFLSFKNRVITKMKEIMEVWTEHTSKRILVVTHFHDINAIEAWLAEYSGEPEPDDVDYDHTIYNRDIGYPLEVIWLYKLKNKWNFKRLPKMLDGVPFLFPGIYLVRHAETPWNL
jgi:broad specificity phosphatase PhoE